MSFNSLNKGQVITVSTVNHNTTGIFKDIVVIAQIMPALVVEVNEGINRGCTRLYPVQNIVSITLPDSSILTPTIEDTKASNLLKL
jgi:hypothetical protein